jgi:hypothetical protein
MRVTFDTNTFDKAVRPLLYPKDPDNSLFVKIHEAIKRCRIEGFICDSMITLEGIKADDRAKVFGSTSLNSKITPDEVSSVIRVDLKMEQPLRQPLHPKQAERFAAALDLGIKLIGAPRAGMPRLGNHNGDDPYAVETEDALSTRISRFHDIAEAIERRGLGSVPAKRLALNFAGRAAPSNPWFKILGTVQDIHESREVARAIAEWADGDSIAAHYGYGNDVFCTGDEAKSGNISIFDSANRAWLANTYGIRFATLKELAAAL